MVLTKDYQLPKKLEGANREQMTEYYSKFSGEKRRYISRSIQAMEIRDNSLISHDLHEAQQAIYSTLLHDMVEGWEKLFKTRKKRH